MKMSLYYDAVNVLSTTALQGSLKSRIYNKSNYAQMKSKPEHVYALVSEAAKYDVLLKEVIENTELLSQERKLTPVLSLLLVHDFLFSKTGIAASGTHPLKLAIERHKARIQAEFTKARVRRKCATVEELKETILAAKQNIGGIPQPRWARINRVKTTLPEILKSHFAGYERSPFVSEVLAAPASARILHIDENVKDLLAFPPGCDMTKTDAYGNGEIILQDKASCFPAVLLLGDAETLDQDCGDVVDGCAAPGNKTTHLAAILFVKAQPVGDKVKPCIFACERDPIRSKTLHNMVAVAGAASMIHVLAKQDFLALDTSEPRFKNVTHVLLDPSCSGSGMIGREDIPKLNLPEDSKAKNGLKAGVERRRDSLQKSLKRKRNEAHMNLEGDRQMPSMNSAHFDAEETFRDASEARLQKLSNLQSRIVEHAMTFPLATRITYSTCSIHLQENEAVVARVLKSGVAKARGWRLLLRTEQANGLSKWPFRGIIGEAMLPTNSSALGRTEDVVVSKLDAQSREACIRCYPGTDEGTMGFFVCAFTRDPPANADADGDGWEGFAD